MGFALTRRTIKHLSISILFRQTSGGTFGTGGATKTADAPLNHAEFGHAEMPVENGIGGEGRNVWNEKGTSSMAAQGGGRRQEFWPDEEEDEEETGTTTASKQTIPQKTTAAAAKTVQV